jgi:hypothetical protein
MLIRTVKIALVGLALSGAVAGAAAPRAEHPVTPRPEARRATHRPAPVEGCFVPPPNPVVITPCRDDEGTR